MRIFPPFEEKIRQSIRNELAKKPTVTMLALKEQMQKEFGRDFHFSYLRKLVGKVRNEISYEIDTARIEPRMAEMRENFRVMREKLLEIVYWTPEDHREGMPKPLARDRVEAAKSVVMLDLAILNAEAAAGMYKKPIADIAKQFQYEPLPGEVRVAVIAAWQRGGLLSADKIDHIVPNVV
jgi:hypothetical protein